MLARIIPRFSFLAGKSQVIIEDIKICNFCEIINDKGKKKKCLCGGIYTYKEGITVKYHRNGKMQEVYVTGKICKDCGRKLIVRHIVLSEIHNDTY